MIGEQSISFSCWNDDKSKFVQVQISLRLEPYSDADVTVSLDYKPLLPEVLQDAVHQGIYNGVHAGLANIAAPFPDNGITIEVTQLSLSSQPPITSFDDAQFLADMFESQIMGMVAGLWGVGLYLDNMS